jgi:phospholipid-transporting ATPase
MTNQPPGDPKPSTRIIRINSAQSQKFKNNSISTGKYTFLTFLPKFLYEQFRKYANIFFLTIGLLQQIPGISPTGRWITIGPLGVILTITAIKEIVEDFKRHREDRKINDSKVEVLNGTKWNSVSWKDVCVGDIVLVKSEKSFPADLILLSSSDKESQCYIETANLDGETNLKIRTALTGTKLLKDAATLASLRGNPTFRGQWTHNNPVFRSGDLEAELPNKNLYDFTGNMTKSGDETQPIGPNEVQFDFSKLSYNTFYRFCFAAPGLGTLNGCSVWWSTQARSQN